jgi:hypothetical protein
MIIITMIIIIKILSQPHRYVNPPRQRRIWNWNNNFDIRHVFLFLHNYHGMESTTITRMLRP